MTRLFGPPWPILSFLSHLFLPPEQDFIHSLFSPEIHSPTMGKEAFPHFQSQLRSLVLLPAASVNSDSVRTYLLEISPACPSRPELDGQ